DPRPIVHFGFVNVDTSLSNRPLNPLRLAATLSVSRGNFTAMLPGAAADPDQGILDGEHFWTLPAGATDVGAGLQVDLRDQPTGVYDYTVNAGIVSYSRLFPNGDGTFRLGGQLLGTFAATTGHIININEVNSPFG